MRRAAPVVGLYLLLVFGGLALGRQHQTLFTPPSAGPRERADVLLDVLGEFRTILARYLWFKMDLFHEVLDDQGVDHEKQTEVLPLLRMVSLLDSSMTDAYDIIAWDLVRGHRAYAQALTILDEGLERNPKSYLLHFRKTMTLFQDKQYSAALESARQTVPLARDEFEQLNANRLLLACGRELERRDVMLEALQALLALRPEESYWQQLRADVEAGRPIPKTVAPTDEES